MNENDAFIINVFLLPSQRGYAISIDLVQQIANECIVNNLQVRRIIINSIDCYDVVNDTDTDTAYLLPKVLSQGSWHIE